MNKKYILLLIILVVTLFGLWYINTRGDLEKTEVTETSRVQVEEKTETTQKPVTTSPIKTIQTSSSATTSVPEKGVVVVTYTSKGFNPFIAEVKLGDSVRFVNERGDRALWVASTHPEGTAEFFAGFSGSRSLKRGESFIIPFTKVGAWSYKNINDAGHQGVILVK